MGEQEDKEKAAEERRRLRKEKKEQEKAAAAVKPEGKIKQEVPAQMIDLDDDDDDLVVVTPVAATSATKALVKVEKRPEKKDKKDKKPKVKREKPNDRDRSPAAGKRKEAAPAKEKKKRKQESSSSSSSSEESSESEETMYRKFRPYTKVQLVDLVRKAELNGLGATVVHPSCAVCPCPPGCILVRLESGREIAVKPKNLSALQTFHRTAMQGSVDQKQRVKNLLKTIQMNADTVTDETTETTSHAILDSGSGTQGGIGHML